MPELEPTIAGEHLEPFIMIGHFPGCPATDGDLCECEPLIHWSQGDTTIEIDANRLCFDSGREVPIILATESRRGLALATPIVDALKDELRARKIDVMIIDPFVRCRLVSERPNKRRRRSVGRHRRLLQRGDYAIRSYIRKRRSHEHTIVQRCPGSWACNNPATAVRFGNRI